MTLIISPDRIRAARQNAGLSPAEAARRSGVGQRTLAAYEAGDIVPGGDRLGRMATAYGVSVEQFFIHDPERDSASAGRGKPTDGAAAARRSPVGAHQEG